MKTDLTINATSATDGKKVTNKITYVNPNITNNQAITLAQAINDLTTDSYTKTVRTDTTDCDDTSAPIRTGNCTIGGVTQAYSTQNPSLTYTVPTSAITNNEFNIQLDNFSIFTDVPYFENNALPIVIVNWKSGSAAGTGRRLVALTVKLTSSEAQTVTGTLVIPPNGATREQNLNLTIEFEA